MQDPFEPTAEQGEATGARAAPDEIVAARGPRADTDPALTRSTNPEGPLREIAHAFRLNAEALHTLKQMQSDLSRQVRAGDRSELVVQSTQALNETFRNLSSVQQELLRRLRVGAEGSRRGPLIPLMLLGLLVVLLGGIYLILGAIEERVPADPELAPAEVARRERDAWKEGRREGEAYAEREIKHLQSAAEEAKARSGLLQGEIDAKMERIADLDRGKRTAEIERDDFAGQVRKAQGEMMAKRVLEDEVGALKLQLDAANRAAGKAEHDLDLQRRQNAWLRERAADRGMGIPDDDPPWRPGVDAGARPPASERLPAGRRASTPLENLARAGRDRLRKMGVETDAEAPLTDPRSDAPDDSSVPPPAYGAPPPATHTPTVPGAVQPRGAAYGGDGTGPLPPPTTLRRRGAQRPPAAQPASASAPATTPEQVRVQLNTLLRSADTQAGAGWRLTRVQGVTAGGLAGVVMVRYGEGGRAVETVEARDVRIAVDRGRREVEFALRDGVRHAAGQQLPLPRAGSRVVVARGSQAEPWQRANLTVVTSR